MTNNQLIKDLRAINPKLIHKSKFIKGEPADYYVKVDEMLDEVRILGGSMRITIFATGTASVSSVSIIGASFEGTSLEEALIKAVLSLSKEAKG